jgi:hypothetical protein
MYCSFHKKEGEKMTGPFKDECQVMMERLEEIERMDCLTSQDYAQRRNTLKRFYEEESGLVPMVSLPFDLTHGFRQIFVKFFPNGKVIVCFTFYHHNCEVQNGNDYLIDQQYDLCDIDGNCRGESVMKMLSFAERGARNSLEIAQTTLDTILTARSTFVRKRLSSL